MRSVEADTLYLAGDVFDDHNDKHAKWDDTHDVTQEVLSGRFRRLVFTPGNHDDWMAHYYGSYARRVIVAEHYVHVCLNGQRMIVTHGHQFDAVTQSAPIVARISSVFDRAMRAAALSVLPADTELRIAKTLNKSVSRIVAPRLEQKLAKFVQHHKVDGIICGHFHDPKITDINGIKYANCGDWVDNCTALVEDAAGLRLIEWGQT